ncbi:MAG TPA: PHP domain-containing protein [Ktedonobacteraceae bacterium]|nr:PHP domain-containing protein [Ktedonobacteraceae bacterium]
MQLCLSSDTPIDLQLHTTYSDGRWSAEQLFDHLAQEGFGLVAVTDHDRVDTVERIQRLGAHKQVPVLAAVEISAAFQGTMADVLLCFGFDPRDQALRATADDVRQRQKDNAEQVYEELQRRGYRFPLSHDLRVAGDRGILLLKQGAVPDWLGALALITDAGYREMKADIRQTVETAHRSGGVALITHPGRGLRELQEFTDYTPKRLDQVRAEIPLDGIEVYYPTHSPEQVETYLSTI